jgi:hypothetical protein
MLGFISQAISVMMPAFSLTALPLTALIAISFTGCVLTLLTLGVAQLASYVPASKAACSIPNQWPKTDGRDLFAIFGGNATALTALENGCLRLKNLQYWGTSMMYASLLLTPAQRVLTPSPSPQRNQCSLVRHQPRHGHHLSPGLQHRNLPLPTRAPAPAARPYLALPTAPPNTQIPRTPHPLPGPNSSPSHSPRPRLPPAPRGPAHAAADARRARHRAARRNNRAAAPCNLHSAQARVLGVHGAGMRRVCPRAAAARAARCAAFGGLCPVLRVVLLAVVVLAPVA